MAEGVLHAEDNMLQRAEPARERKLQQLERLMQSRTFQASENLISLLNYLVRDSIDHPDAQLKEYTIATEVLGRGAEFDPRTDSVVRVQAKRLRTKLQEYYQNEGKSDQILIDLPKGHYKVTFSHIHSKNESLQFVAPTATHEPLSESQIRSYQSRKRLTDWRNYLIAALLTLTASALLLGFFKIDLGSRAEISSADFGPVWEPFIKSNTPVLVILSNPPVYRFLNDADPVTAATDSLEIPAERAGRLNDVLRHKLISKQNRIPRLVLSLEDYTGMGEAIGLYQITSLLDSAGKPPAVKQSRTMSAEDMKSRNVILLGSAWVNDWVEKLPIKEDFSYTVNATIENHNPLPGEDREYRPRFNQQTDELEEDYALITVKPGVTDDYRLMILSGLLSEGTQGAAEYVSRREYLNALNQHLKKLEGGPPKYYQVLLKVDVDDGIPTTVSILSIRKLNVTRH